MTVEHSLRPFLTCALAVATLSVMDATIKYLTALYPLGQVIGLRFAVGALAGGTLMVAVEGRPGVGAMRRSLLRAVTVILTSATFFTAISRLALADAIALTFFAPLLMALLGRALLGEPVAPATWLAIGLGFMGVLVIANGQAVDTTRTLDWIGIAAALACAFFYALTMVLMRKQTAADSMFTIVGLSNIFAFGMIAPVAAWQWQSPGWIDLGIFILCGLLGTLGHLLMAWSYKRAPAGRLGILEYTAFIWGIGLGYLYFREVPTAWTLAGATLIIAASLCTAWKKLPRREPQLPEA